MSRYDRSYLAARWVAQEARKAGGESVNTDAPKPSKYGNKKVNGYDSAREAKRAAELRLLEQAGEIRDLREQVPYILIPKQLDEQGKTVERACSFLADFVYRTREGVLTVEDVKGMKTEVYRIKKKLLRFVYGIAIKET